MELLICGLLLFLTQIPREGKKEELQGQARYCLSELVSPLPKCHCSKW